jgi:hypothetical protein
LIAESGEEGRNESFEGRVEKVRLLLVLIELFSSRRRSAQLL